MKAKSDNMIDCRQARNEILGNPPTPEARWFDVSEVCGLVLSDDIRAPHPLPLFDQSAVDGFGIKVSAGRQDPLALMGEIRAGRRKPWHEPAGGAVRIYTGAPVPSGVDAIVMQEDVIRANDSIRLGGIPVKRGMNIRKKGRQVREGAVALRAGAVMTPAALGFAASLGITRVRAFRRPAVALIVTGDEVVSKGGAPKPGQVFDANGMMLRHAAQRWSDRTTVRRARDRTPELKRIIRSAMIGHDVILVSGGVSVGRYDLVRPVLESLGFTIRFHRVRQKPGKPLLFATAKHTAVFGLPGNPLSAWVCFYEYVFPYLRMAMGHRDPFLPEYKLPLEAAVTVTDREKVKFLPAVVGNAVVKPAAGQPSHMLGAAATATAIVSLPAGRLRFRKGEKVRTRLLPEG